MNRRKKSNNKILTEKSKIIRCRIKMIPVFENDNCKDFIKKEQADANNICKCCKNSF